MIIILRRDFTKICWACSCTSKVLFGTLNTGFWPEVILSTGRFALTFWGSILVAVPNLELQGSTKLFNFAFIQRLAFSTLGFAWEGFWASINLRFPICELHPARYKADQLHPKCKFSHRWGIHPCQSLVCRYFCSQKFSLKPKRPIVSNMPICVGRKRPKLDFCYLWACKISTVTLCSEEQGDHSHTNQKGVVDRVRKTVGKNFLPAN